MGLGLSGLRLGLGQRGGGGYAVPARILALYDADSVGPVFTFNDAELAKVQGFAGSDAAFLAAHPDWSYFQDSGATTPAYSDGDTLALIRDRRGDIDAALSGYTLGVTGGRWFAEDGGAGGVTISFPEALGAELGGSQITSGTAYKAVEFPVTSGQTYRVAAEILTNNTGGLLYAVIYNSTAGGGGIVYNISGGATWDTGSSGSHDFVAGGTGTYHLRIFYSPGTSTDFTFTSNINEVLASATEYDIGWRDPADGAGTFVENQECSGATVFAPGDFYEMWATDSAPTDLEILAAFEYQIGPLREVDIRADLSGATWALETGTVYKTTVTFTDTPTNLAGATSNSTHFIAWNADALMDWQVGGADIAANIANVAAQTGRFTVHRSGSTVQDPRSDTAGTQYVFYVNIGGDPTGQAVKIADTKQVSVTADAVSTRYIGGYAKDHLTFQSAPTPPTLTNCTIVDVPAHGSVWPFNGAGTHTVTGRVVAGSAAAAVGRNIGGAVNLYTNTPMPTTDLTFERIVAENTAVAVYGHGSSNTGWRDLSVAELVATNVSQAIQFDTYGAYLPFISGTATFGTVDIDACEIFIRAGGNVTVNGGTVAMATNAQSLDVVKQTLFFIASSGSTFTIKNVSWQMGLTAVENVTNFNLCETSPSLAVKPTLILDNCHDLSATPAQMAHLSGYDASRNPHLVLTGGTSLGDLQRTQKTTYHIPASLTVDAGCTFGLGNRTGPQIETFLDSVGTSHDISGDTTIVSRAGTVLSSPGWK